jgi:hypothetical protein
MLAGAIPSHMQLWSDEEGPFLIQDWRMMFGCRAAANFASRVSGLITWLLDRVIDEIDLVELAAGDTNPGAPEKWGNLLAMVQELHETREVSTDGKAKYAQGPVLAFANFFIDDFPMLGVAGTGKAVLSVFASLLYALNIDPQWKKVLPEGDFAQQ